MIENIAGEWFGYITQTPTGLADRYIFQLNLKEEDGKIKGQSYIAIDEDSSFGIMDIECEVVNGKLLVNEVEIVDQQLYIYAYWCMKSYSLELKMENGVSVLEGAWVSDFCGDSKGNIHLERRLS